MNRKFALALILLTTLTPTTILVSAGKPAKKPPKVATFVITFKEGDIVSESLETVTNVENWEPEIVKGKGREKKWSIELYSVIGSFILVDVLWNPEAPDPSFGLNEYPEDSSVCDFFDANNPITISWLEHVYSRDYDYWNFALDQTDKLGHNYHLIGSEGTGVYDAGTDTWTVVFNQAYCYIQWWEWLGEEGPGVFHNVWKGYLTFIVTIQKLPK